MTLLIQYVVDGPGDRYFINQSLVYIGGPGENPLEFRKVRREFKIRARNPKMPKILEIFKEFGTPKEDWNKEVKINPKFQEEMAKLFGIDTFLRNTLLYIQLPRNVRLLFKQGQRGSDPTRGIVNPETGRVNVRRRSVRRILRRYKLRVENPPTLPYLHFDDNNDFSLHSNCLVNHLLKTYVNLNKNKRIAENKILKYFKDVQDIENLKSFCTKFRIRLRLYDVFLKPVYFDLLESVQTSKRRKDLTAIIYHSHIYPYTKKLKKKIDGEVDRSKMHELNVVDTFGNYTQEIDRRDEISKYVTKKLTPNFFHKSESSIVFKSFCRNEMDKDNDIYVAIDMNKAFYTAIHKYTEPTEKIPTFAVEDTFAPFNQEEYVVNHYYYLVSETALNTMRANPISWGYIDNLLHGFEVIFLLNEGILKKTDIEFVKKSYYYITNERFVTLLKDVKREFNIGGKQFRDNYLLYNGLLGMVYKRFNSTHIWCEEQIDSDLLAANRCEIPDYNLDQCGTSISFGKKSVYRYVNNRNLYNFVIARNRLAMMKTIKKIGVIPVKISTDSVAYVENDKDVREAMASVAAKLKIRKKVRHTIRNGWITFTENGLQFTIPENFKPEVPKMTWPAGTSIIDGKEIARKTKKKLDKFFDKIEVIRGAPGTGKTYKVQHEKTYHFAMTITNVCASVMSTDEVKADTIFKSLSLYDPDGIYAQIQKYQDKTIWIDEFSMIPRYYYNYFYITSLKCDKLIFSGDENQLPPIGESGIDMKSYFTRKFFENSEKLTKDWRNSRGLQRLRDFVLSAKQDAVGRKFHMLSKEHDGEVDPKIRHHIVNSHKMREYINETIMRKLNYEFESVRGEKVVKYKDGKELVSYNYNYRASEGIRLRARANLKSFGIYKNSLYTLLTNVDKESNMFQVVMDGSEDVQEFKINKMRYFCLGYAYTIHSVQSITIKERAAIYQFNQMLYFGRSGLYTAITRLTTEDNMVIYDNPNGFKEWEKKGSKSAYNNEAIIETKDEGTYKNLKCT